ncbi:MAG: ATP12 family chaperone protein [Phenylobacterium sp.]
MQKGFHEPVDKPRKFYKDVSVVEDEGGFAVKLDGRNVRSPRGGKLTAPTRALADLVAEEWAAQTDVIELATMHVTRLAFTALEAIPDAREATARQVAQYAGSDLLCYHATEPEALARRQADRWGPMLDRAEQDLALVFVRTAGIVHAEQPEETLARVEALALELDDFSLAGLAFGTSLFGSAVLAFALQRRWLSGEQAWELSRLDEAYQEEKWGVDEEAAERAERLRGEAAMLDRWFGALT